MSTRATMTVFDRESSFHIYKHYDGDPKTIKSQIEETKVLAWSLPSFEAGEFTAALVSVMKHSE